MRLSKLLFMNTLKRALRLLGMVLLLTLACVGVGLNGGIPLPRLCRKDDATELKAEPDAPTDKSAPQSTLFRLQP
jgi:hypothetical protein